jgi:hypothetical protein
VLVPPVDVDRQGRLAMFADAPHGRLAVLSDPQGTAFSIVTLPAGGAAR